MGNAAAVAAPVYPPLNNKTRICLTGFKVSTHAGRAQQVASLVAATYPDLYETWFRYGWPSEHYAFHAELSEKFGLTGSDHRLAAHKSSPFVWFESKTQSEGAVPFPGREGVWALPIGGRDDLCAWVVKTFPEQSPEHVALRALAVDPFFSDAWVNEVPGTSQQAAASQ